MPYQNTLDVYQQDDELQRLRQLLSSVESLCSQEEKDVTVCSSTSPLVNAASSWIKDASVENMGLFRQLSPLLQKVVGMALRQELTKRLSVLTMTAANDG